MVSSFSMRLSSEKTFEKPSPVRYCEPYVLVTSIDLRSARPDVEAYLYGPWKSVSGKSSVDVAPLVWRESFWKLDVLAAPITKPSDVAFVIVLMEHVNGNPSTVRALAKKAIIEDLNASAGLARETRISNLIPATNRAVDLANGGPNLSSAIELGLTSEDVAHLGTNGPRTFVRSFSGYGGLYCLHFRLSKAEADLRIVAHQRGNAFACAAE